MFRVVSGTALLLVVIFGGLGVAILAQPVDDGGLAALLPTADCPAPCLLGLRPGVTTAEEAAAILASHPWVRDDVAALSGDGVLRWKWNGQQPAVFGWGGGYGEVEIRDGTVALIRILTPVPFADFWLLLGRPDKGTLGRARVMPETHLTHRAVYSAYGLELKTVIPRSGDIRGFWEAAVEIQVAGSPPAAGDYALPCWVACG
jgi:hypothetical protein